MRTSIRKIGQAGFTLVELMVVVAIIGILATIAIPQYSKFQAKARQSEAKTSLSAIHQTLLAYAGETQSFSACLANIGFSRDGARLYYTVGFQTTQLTTMVCGPASGKACGSYGWQPDGSGGWTDGTPCLDPQIHFPANTKDAGTLPLQITLTGSVVTQTSFIAQAVGNVFKATDDIWSVNETKLIKNDQLGIQ